MKEIHKLNIQNFCLEISKSQVLDRMECYPGSALYEELSDEYDGLLQEMQQHIEPKMAFTQGIWPKEIWNTRKPSGVECLFLLCTIGKEAEKYSSVFFSKGDYVKGMMADYIADAYLFAMEKANMEAVRSYCAQIHRGIAKRLCAPENIPMEAQKTIFQAVKADDTLGLNILDSYMYDPVKSMGQIYILTEDEGLFQAQHDCGNCKNRTCKMRTVSNNKT